MVLVLFDTQWWLHRHDRPRGEVDGCSVQNEEDFITAMNDVLKKHRYKQVLLVGHHPFYSNGEHGGHFTARQYLFPATEAVDWLYLPIPLIYPAYRALVGDIQDLAHQKYQALVQSMEVIMANHENIIYAAGHEHNLQHISKNGNEFIVSGSGSKETYVQGNRQIEFGFSKRGFAKVIQYTSGESWVEYYIAEGSEKGKVVYRKMLDKIEPSKDVESTEVFIQPGNASFVPDPTYEAGGLHKGVFGTLYRDVWTTEITVPYADIKNEKGGLTPVQRGGGLQTKSLRLENPDGKQWVMRSIAKYPAAALDKSLRNTIVEKIVDDGIAASHPYAAITIPPMADAVGVFHTNAEMRVVPDDPSLGQYREEFANMPVIFEERPKGNMTGFENYGNTEKVIGSSDLIIKLRDNYKHKIDEIALLRARLFDMVIADWDRHDDQWRWARFKKGEVNYYKPIPRDRDQAFFKQDGLIPNIVNRKWAVRKFQSFEPDIRDIAGQNFNARYLDRAYLVQSDKATWLAVADSIKSELTDDIIENAIKRFPKQTYDMKGQEIISTLKARRDKVVEFAERYYQVLAEIVSVVATDKDDYIHVERLNDDEVRVSVYPRNKEGKPKLDQLWYQRTFKTDETKEVRIYGLGGEDYFMVEGNVKKSVKLRLIGGADFDTYQDESSVAGLSRKTRIYDQKDEGGKPDNDFEHAHRESKNILYKNEEEIEYDREDFIYNVTTPVIFYGFNPDDGAFLGGGFDRKTYGFKKSPFRYRWQLRGNYAFKTGAYNFFTKFQYPNLFKKWGFETTLDVKAPQWIFYFYGLGNETDFEGSEADVRTDLNIFSGAMALTRQIGRSTTLKVGPVFQNFQADFNDEISIPQEDDSYYGGRVTLEVDKKDNMFNPTRGVRFNFDSFYLDGDDGQIDFLKLRSDLSIYFPLSFLPFKNTVAVRVGGATNIGDYRGYHANFLGGFNEMRGIRRNRFAGDDSFYNNIDFRFQLADVKSRIIPVNIGLLGFYDYGRVWVEGENSDVWHNAYGGGLYLSPLNSLVLSASYGVSDVDEVFDIRLGFLF